MFCFQQPYIFIKVSDDDDFTELTISHPSSNQKSTIFIPYTSLDTIIKQLRSVKKSLEDE